VSGATPLLSRAEQRAAIIATSPLTSTLPIEPRMRRTSAVAGTTSV